MREGRAEVLCRQAPARLELLQDCHVDKLELASPPVALPQPQPSLAPLQHLDDLPGLEAQAGVVIWTRHEVNVGFCPAVRVVSSGVSL